MLLSTRRTLAEVDMLKNRLSREVRLAYLIYILYQRVAGGAGSPTDWVRRFKLIQQLDREQELSRGFSFLMRRKVA